MSAELVLFATDLAAPVDGILFRLAYLLLSFVTVVITEPAPAARVRFSAQFWIWVQLGVVMVFVLLTAWRGLEFHRVLRPDAAIPLWSPLLATVQRLGEMPSATVPGSRIR